MRWTETTLCGGGLFDVDATLLRVDDAQAVACGVNHDGEIAFLSSGGLFDQAGVNVVALQSFAEQAMHRGRHVLCGLAAHHAPGLATTADWHLGLDDPGTFAWGECRSLHLKPELPQVW